MGAYKVAGGPRNHWQIWSLATGFLLVTSLHFYLKQRQQQMDAAAANTRAANGLPDRPLRLAIFNQVNIHLHVVAGAMHVLRPLSSAAVTVFLSAEVLEGNLYGFMDEGWIGSMEGFNWRDVKQFDQEERFDLVWFISPEWDTKYISSVAQQMNPRMALYYVHNGHMPEEDFDILKGLSPELPLLTMAPHVAQYVRTRLQENSSSTAAAPAAAPAAAQDAEWVLPIFPYQPAEPCTHQQAQVSRRLGSGPASWHWLAWCACVSILACLVVIKSASNCTCKHHTSDGLNYPGARSLVWLALLLVTCAFLPWALYLSCCTAQGGEGCLSGFSIAGSTDSSLRNYSRMWEQIRSYKQQQGAAALTNFKLKILGQIMDNFTVPGELLWA
jgi:hypothetical protein